MIVGDSVAAVAILLWMVVLAKAPGTLRAGAAPARWLLASLVGIAVGATFFAPAVGAAVEGATGLQLQEPLARSAVLFAAFSAQTLLVLLTRGDRSPREHALDVAIFGAAVAVLWVTFAFGPATPTARFGSRAEADMRMTVFLLVFLMYLGQSVVRVLSGCWQYSLHAAPAMRHGLRLIAAGCASGLGYIGVKLASVVLLYVGAPLPFVVERTAGRSMAVVAGALVAAGACLPTVSEWFADARRWCSEYRAYRQLYPLWSCLTAAVPAVTLDPASGWLTDAARVRQMHLRLYRRLIELRDARLEFRPVPVNDAVARCPALPAARHVSPAMWGEAAALLSAVAPVGARLQVP